LPELARVAPARRRPSLSYELFPARTEGSFDKLRETVAKLEATDPDYVSVTSRTGQRNLDRVLELVDHVLFETSLRPLVHLTSIESTRSHLIAIIDALLDRGVRGILALRGDPRPGHDPESDEVPFARPLVELIREVERRRTAMLAGGRVSVGVAAYPMRHPESPTSQLDLEVLVAKERAGADFAITQVFFDPKAYCSLVERARAAGVVMPIVPGFIPATSPRRLGRLGELSGVYAPREHLHALEIETDPVARRKIGVRFTVDLISQVMDAGAPGLHLYTYNRHTSALEVLEHLDLDRWSVPVEGELPPSAVSPSAATPNLTTTQGDQ
jgi:methylenetetrahydrofolate reductase (NADPH)